MALFTKKEKQPKLKGRERSVHIFSNMPIWKGMLIMAIPSMIIMLVNGAYFFSDSVISINMAADSYSNVHVAGMESGDLVRLFMNAYSPINSLMIAFAIMFAMGISTRVAINLGAKRHEKAVNTLKTGFSTGILISVLLIPVLIFAAKPWMASQYDGSISGIVSDNGFDYAWIIIASFPMMMFNNIISSMLRTEARMKEMMIAMIAPIFINLGMDAVMMGPVGMGVEGGAWATFISTAVTTIILLIMIWRKQHQSMITFKNLFTVKLQAIVLFGIFLVGITPFIRNMAQSITQTVQMNVLTEVSTHVYSGHAADIMSDSQKVMIEGLMKVPHNSLSNAELLEKAHQAYLANPSLVMIDAPHSIEANFMAKIVTGASPVFMLFFPIMFGFVQAAGPLASFNYGAKNYARVKQTYWWAIIFAASAAIIMYFIGSFALGGVLMNALHVSGIAKTKALVVLKIMMATMPLFGMGIGAMVLFGSTDRLFQSLIASSMQGLIVFFPVIFSFKGIAFHSDWEYAFWFFWPVSGLITSIVNSLLAIYTLKHLDRPGHITIDERVEKVYAWAKSKKLRPSKVAPK